MNESLWLLIPLSAALVLAIIAVFGWALNSGQFDELDHEGQRILDDDAAAATSTAPPLDGRQHAPPAALEQSSL